MCVSNAQVDRECGSDMTNLWLDVVLIVDNSELMTTNGITEMAATTTRAFGNARFGMQNSDPRNTRFSIVTYNTSATIVADLNQIQSSEEFYSAVFSSMSSVSSSQESFLSVGLETAENILLNGRQNKTRARYQQLIVVYASSYIDKIDPLPIAKRLKSNGVSIVTMACEWSGNTGLKEKLLQISSPGFNFTSNDLNMVQELQWAAAQTNCFCPGYDFQYRADFSDESSRKYGICILVSLLPDPWITAKIACQNAVLNGYLVTVFDKQKHDFLFAIAKNNTFYDAPYNYHIGLNFVNGGWNWQQPSGFSLIPLGSYAPWNPTYPKSVQLTGVAEQQNGEELTIGWENINVYQEKKLYMCEVASCDTDNFYCS